MSDMSQDLRRRAASIVNAFDESLAATGVARLTEDQREVLKAFLVILYEKAQERSGEEEQRVSAPLVG